MRSRADEYRRLARECLELVYTVATERARLTLTEMAQTWTRLADEQDQAFPPNVIDQSQPLIQPQQQQQQVQSKKDGTE
jgi:hypothetical protein